MNKTLNDGVKGFNTTLCKVGWAKWTPYWFFNIKGP